MPDRESTIREELTGIVSDAICKGQHFRKALTPLTCTLKCVGEGADYVLATGDTVYVLEGHRAELDKFAGGRATVRGRANADHLIVDSIIKTEKKVRASSRSDG